MDFFIIVLLAIVAITCAYVMANVKKDNPKETPLPVLDAVEAKKIAHSSCASFDNLIAQIRDMAKKGRTTIHLVEVIRDEDAERLRALGYEVKVFETYPAVYSISW